MFIWWVLQQQLFCKISLLFFLLFLCCVRSVVSLSLAGIHAFSSCVAARSILIGIATLLLLFCSFLLFQFLIFSLNQRNKRITSVNIRSVYCFTYLINPHTGRRQISYLRCNSTAVRDLRNQSKRNCGAACTAARSSSYTFSLSNPNLCNIHTKNLETTKKINVSTVKNKVFNCQFMVYLSSSST